MGDPIRSESDLFNNFLQFKQGNIYCIRCGRKLDNYLMPKEISCKNNWIFLFGILVFVTTGLCVMVYWYQDLFKLKVKPSQRIYF